MRFDSCFGSPRTTSSEVIISTGGPINVSLRAVRVRPHIGVMHLDLTDEETAALTQELHDIVEGGRYPFSPRIRKLRAILAKLRRPEPAREPLPPPKVYAPPRFILARRRR